MFVHERAEILLQSGVVGTLVLDREVGKFLLQIQRLQDRSEIRVGRRGEWLIARAVPVSLPN